MFYARAIEELALYCAIVLSKEEIAELGLTDVCHTRARAGGQRPGITTLEISGRTEKNKDKSLFVKPKREPDQCEVRMMFAEALRILIETAMSNHIYTWDKNIKKQSKGGAIGSDLTGELGVFIMLVWSSVFSDKVKKATESIPDWELHMQQIYVDDCDMITDPLPPGSRLIDQRIVIVEEEVDKDCDIPADKRTAEILTAIGNSIFNFIRLTCDYPSAHPSGLMPILDIQTRVEDGQVIYLFYKKDVANPLLLRASSAMPLKMKRTALIQEALRRLLRTKRELPWKTRADILSEFSHKMLCSGYWEQFRLEVIKEAIRLYDQKCLKADQGLEPLHRLRSYKREERRKKKLLAPYV